MTDQSPEARVGRGLHPQPGPHCVMCGKRLTVAETIAQTPDHDEICAACGGPAPRQPTRDERLQMAKDEIVGDMLAKRIPLLAQSFAELHDYVDANEYGGLCEPDAPEPESIMDEANYIQDTLDAWISSGIAAGVALAEGWVE